MKLNVKKILLAGSAIVAVSAFSGQANAAAQTLTAPGTWASAGTHGGTSTGTASDALANDAINNSTFLLTVTNNQTANDNSGLNTFNIGAITGTTGGLTVVSGAAVAPALSVTAASIALSGAANIAVSNVDAHDSTVTLGVTGALSTGGNLTLTNTETSTADTVNMTVGTTSAVTGTTTLTGGAFAGANTNLTSTGNATLTGAVAVNAGSAGNATLTLNGAGAQSFGSTLAIAGGTTGTASTVIVGSTTVAGAASVTAGSGGAASLTLGGAANTFTSGLALTNGTTAHALLTLNGSVAQAVTGNITGNGDIVLANTSTGATFNGTVAAGSIKLDSGAGTGSTAIFKNTVNSTGGIILGNAAGVATNVLTLDSTAQSFTVTGAVSGTLAGQTNNIIIQGGANTVTLANDVGANIDNITVAVGTGLAAKSLTATGAVTLNGATTVNGSITAGSTVIGVAGSATLTGATGTVGAITATGNNVGALTIGNGTTASVYTVGGALGTGGNRLGALTLANLSTVNLSNNVFANSLVLGGASSTTNITGSASVGLTSTTSTTIDGTFTTALTGGSVLTLNSDGNAITIGGTANTTISAGNQIALNSTSNTFGAHTTNLLINKTASFDPTATPVINASVAGATAVKFVTGSVLNVSIAPGSLQLVNGSAITVIDGNAAVQLNGAGTTYTALETSGNVVLNNTGLVRFVDNTSTAQDLLVKAVFVDTATTLATQANAATATALENFPGATGTLATARTNLLNAPTAAAANSVAESLAPPSDGAAAQAALDVTDNIFGITTVRLASLRDGSAESGMAAGNTSHGARAWGEGFGRTATQDRRNGTAGYDADTGGAAFGMDGETSNGSHLGMAVSYANTDVKSKNANTTKTQIDSYQVSVYGDTPIDEHMFLNGMAAYVFNDNDTTRHNVGGIGGLNADGSFNANQFVVQGELGRDFRQMNGLTLTPNVMANYSHYDAQKYTETGAGTANLNVDGDALDTLDVGVGIDAVWDIDNHDGSKLQPSLTAGYRYDVIGDSLDSNASFTGGGAAFKAQGVDPARSTYTAAAGLKYYTTANWELSARYTFDAKEDYTAHTGMLRAAYKFK